MLVLSAAVVACGALPAAASDDGRELPAVCKSVAKDAKGKHAKAKPSDDDDSGDDDDDEGVHFDLAGACAKLTGSVSYTYQQAQEFGVRLAGLRQSERHGVARDQLERGVGQYRSGSEAADRTRRVQDHLRRRMVEGDRRRHHERHRRRQRLERRSCRTDRRLYRHADELLGGRLPLHRQRARADGQQRCLRIRGRRRQQSLGRRGVGAADLARHRDRHQELRFLRSGLYLALALRDRSADAASLGPGAARGFLGLAVIAAVPGHGGGPHRLGRQRRRQGAGVVHPRRRRSELAGNLRVGRLVLSRHQYRSDDLPAHDPQPRPDHRLERGRFVSPRLVGRVRIRMPSRAT